MYLLCSLCMTKGGDENLVDKRVYWSWLIMHAIFQMAHDYSLEAALSAATKQNMFKCHFGNLLRNCFSFRANLSPKGMLCLVIETFLGTKVSSFIMLIRNILTAEQKSKPNIKWPSVATSSKAVSAKNLLICYVKEVYHDRIFWKIAFDIFVVGNVSSWTTPYLKQTSVKESCYSWVNHRIPRGTQTRKETNLFQKERVVVC